MYKRDRGQKVGSGGSFYAVMPIALVVVGTGEGARKTGVINPALSAMVMPP